MNPQCAKCSKTVYPMEKMSVLDKYWHKGCFRCETCDLKLTLKTYKGYSKKPYCNTHYPTTKFTAVADTPENKRLAKNTQNQSKVNYTKQFEEDRGKFTSNPNAVTSARDTYDPPPMNTGYQSNPPPMNAGYQSNPPPMSYHSSNPPPRKAEPAPYQPPPQQPLPSIVQQPLPPVPTQAEPQGARYQALYDYSAADDDEVSFNEGDFIIDVTVIDDGWMEGRVQQSGQYGMLPSNYVEKV
ncbi:LIM and SH3 domain protein 1-like [Antedon mediterranea]|uniref:LIM and SH3 domain protein 1-like n=1 Tax=Antedon mediterranea TaxID=105859 RepID=UPI003AF82F2D